MIGLDPNLLIMCHRWVRCIVYAGNAAWATHNPRIPMVAPPPNFPTLYTPPFICSTHCNRGRNKKGKRAPDHISCPPPIMAPYELRFLGCQLSRPSFCREFHPSPWKLDKSGGHCTAWYCSRCASSFGGPRDSN